MPVLGRGSADALLTTIDVLVAIPSQRHITMLENDELLAAVGEVDLELAITQLERRKARKKTD
ncbi:hypothetical protein PsorP6_006608 [Peronosclerospora sorghi]|uniref:Uncharacterized protein n=1 Tax=Peronosclerospora sorghi TaxID=230839 RepID=A0ACC0W409_9STRA|nr:hypothetical protein PsorP6_006608 [Peronosclerospora sorghi]